MDDKKKKQAEDYLSRSPLLHMDMLESVRHGTARLIAVSQHGVLLFNTACEAVMMSAQNETEAERMLALLPPCAPMFVAHQNFYIGRVKSRFSFQKSITCVQAVYTKKQPLPELPNKVEIRVLGEEFLPFLEEHYSRASDDGSLLDRLRAGVMFGAFLRETPAGFIGLHEEGSMGMLEVLPKFRRMGVAQALETFLVNRLLAEGKVPFAQIVVGNEASLRLHRKLCFSVSQNTLCWLM